MKVGDLVELKTRYAHIRGHLENRPLLVLSTRYTKKNTLMLGIVTPCGWEQDIRSTYVEVISDCCKKSL